jgi:hypothetical protein
MGPVAPGYCTFFLKPALLKPFSLSEVLFKGFFWPYREGFFRFLTGPEKLKRRITAIFFSLNAGNIPSFPALLQIASRTLPAWGVRLV